MVLTRKLLCLQIVLCVVLVLDKYFFQADLSQLSEYDAKPIILGEEMCARVFNDSFSIQITREYLRLLLSKFTTKVPLRSFLDGKKVFVKKLGRAQDYQKAEAKWKSIVKNRKIEELSHDDVIKEITSNVFSETSQKLFLCPNQTDISPFLNLFFNPNINNIYDLIYSWTALEVNPEPLMLKILQPPNWPVPKYYGSCGKLVFVEDCGTMLSDFYSAPWSTRNNLAIKVLKLALQFTFQHPRFGFYWTDPSPDNLAVGESGEVKLIDLEDVFVVDKFPSNVDEYPHFHSKHSSVHVECEDCYIFHPKAICEYQISDHNILTVCRELLASTSLVFKGGFLHDPPAKAAVIADLLHECIWNEKRVDRFYVAQEIINTLKLIPE